MATTGTKKPCAKCSKGAGVTTCDGCQQCFCTKHFVEHRQELSQRMDLIRDDHRRFQQEATTTTTTTMIKESPKHPYLTRIDTWERESIAKIQAVAEASRNELRQLLDRTKIELKISMEKINDELQNSRQTEDFTESDLKRWTEQLKELRKRLETPPTILLSNDDDPNAVIRLIKVIEKSTLTSRSSIPTTIRPIEHRLQSAKDSFSGIQEKFVECDGKATISEDGLLVTGCLASILTQPIIYGANRYSSGKHQIRFRIEKMAEARLFFGIIRSLENISRSGQGQTNNNHSLNGWWDLNEAIVNGRTQTSKYRHIVSTGDELIFTIDCDGKQIQLQHQRTKRLAQLTIDLEKCPFPWKLVIRLQSAGDCVRILQ